MELQLNGKTVERKPVRNCVARFRLPYAPGTLEAVVYDTAGQETGRNALHTAGKATLLQALPEELSALPDIWSLCGFNTPTKPGLLNHWLADG